jgi:hypothetical protein
MAWERRERGGLYYTRSRRVGGRVMREYLGSGELAIAVALLDQERREERDAARDARNRERERHTAIEETLETFACEVEALVAAELEQSGFHLHRGEWRRKRT